MKNIIITVLIFSGIIALVSYSGIVKINAPENFFGRADKISSDGFQYVGKVDLLENQPISSSIKQISGLKNNSIKQSSSNNKTTNITSIIAPTAPAAPIASTTPASTSTVSIEPIAPAPITLVASIVPQTSSNIVNNSSASSLQVGISEILVGVDGNANYEFIELYNPNDAAIDLTGWSIKKRSSSGSESTIVSNSTKYGNFKDKKIMPHKYLLLANKDGYNGSIQPDILYSTTLAYKNNAVILYNANGEAIEDIGWDEIIKGQSLERVSWSSGEFKIQNSPDPQNSQF